MKKRIFTFSLCLLFLVGMVIPLQAQSYTVSTVTPTSDQVINDAITLDESGNLYGSFFGYQGAPGTRIMRIRPNGSYDTLITGLTNPNGINYQDGKLYFSNAYSQLRESDTMGVNQVITTIPGFVNVIPIPNSDSLLGVSYGQNRLYGISANGNNVLSNDPMLDGPAGLAFDHDGILYVSNFNNGEVLKYDGNGGFSLLADIGGGIGFIAYGDSAIFATNYADHKVYRIPTDGGPTTVIAGSGQATTADGVGTAASFNMPNGIAATASGDSIYISEFTGAIVRLMVRNPATGSLDPEPVKEPLLFPVPSQGQFRIDNLDLSGLTAATVYSLNGQAIQALEIEAIKTTSEINLVGMAPGSYQVVFEGAGGQLIHTAMIQILP